MTWFIFLKIVVGPQTRNRDIIKERLFMSKRVTTILRSPESFFEAIPKDIEQNLLFRQRLHEKLAGDAGMYAAYLELCGLKPQIMFNSSLFVYEARAKPGFQHIPFILRDPSQDFAVDRLKLAIDEGHNIIFDKSRDEGASEIICKLFAIYFMLYGDQCFLVGSRVEDYVDKGTGIDSESGKVYGTHKCLFHKILYGLTTLPPYMRPRLRKSHLAIENLDNGSKFDGEATTDNFGAGNRATAVMVDETARIDPGPAQHIIDNIQAVSNCCVYNSTHFKFGSGHPYARLIKSGKVETVVLGWETNPTKNYGLYHSPEEDIIEIKDIGYYRNICPGMFNVIEAGETFSLTDLKLKVSQASELVQEQMSEVAFIADGGTTNYNCDRSPWFDYEEDRAPSRKGVAINILRIPQGSADQFFDSESTIRISKTFVRDPDFVGTLKFSLSGDNRPKAIKFKRGGPKLLKWWGKLPRGRPRQDHNYIVSCDISRGTGASNSVATITDVNTSEQVGVYVNPFIDVSDFAELSVALCLWCGGGTKSAFLLWEGNGPGDTFRNRIRKLHYTFVYYKVDNKKKTKKRPSNRTYGWWSTAGINGTKNALLSDFDAALSESLIKDQRFPFYVIRDQQLVNELEDYIFLGDRIEVGHASEATESSGARFAHGDRVISAALAMLGMKEQPKAKAKKIRKERKNCMASRMQDRRTAKAKEKQVVSKWP